MTVEPLTFVTWKWKPSVPYRSQYSGAHVNTLHSMLRRNYTRPFEMVCVTDDAEGIEAGVRVVPLQHHFADVPNPSSPRNPSCYRRLWAFSAEAKHVLGARFVSLDLDMVITAPLDALLDRDEDFVIWGGQALGPGRLGSYNWYNGSFWMLRAGTRTQVWDKFDPAVSPGLANAANCRGSDQGWIAYCLGQKEALFTEKDGVRSFRNHVVPNGGRLPAGTCVVSFHGRHDPWHKDIQARYSWVREHYR